MGGCLRRGREAAETVRDQLLIESWRCFAKNHEPLGGANPTYGGCRGEALATEVRVFGAPSEAETILLTYVDKCYSFRRWGERHLAELQKVYRGYSSGAWSRALFGVQKESTKVRLVVEIIGI